MNRINKKQINYTLYFFEILASCFVILIHCKLPGTFGLIVDAAARFAVPFFFVISGFFLYDEKLEVSELRQKCKKRILRTTILLGISLITYLIIRIAVCLKNGQSALDYFSNTFSPENILMFIIFNKPFISTHNWFLLALILSYCFILIFPKLFINKRFTTIFPTLIIVIYFIRIIMCTFQPVLFGLNLSNDNIYHAWWNCGLPFITFGILAKRIITGRSFAPSFILTLLFSSAALMCVEGYFISICILPMTYYLFSVAFCFSIFILSIKWPKIHIFSLYNRIGNWTRWVYIFHPIFITLNSSFLKMIRLDECFAKCILPFLTIFSSILFAIFLQSVTVILRIFYNHQKGDTM